MASRVYAGVSARSRREPVVYACPCGERFRAEVWRAVDSSDKEATTRLLDGRLNRARCPSCEADADVQVPVVFHDLEAPRLVLVLPDGLRHRELAERAAFYQALAADLQPAPLYVMEAAVVFGAAGLRAALAPAPTSDAFRALTPVSSQPAVAPVPPAEATVPVVVVTDRDQTNPRAPDPDLVRRSQRAPKPSEKAPPRAEHVDDDQHTRVRVTVPDPRSAMIERWIAGREGPTAHLIDDTVLLVAALKAHELEPFIQPGALELRVQLHRMPTYPLLALTLVAPTRTATRADDARVLTVPLDIARAAHRVVLDALGKKCALTLELYDSQYLPVVSHQVTATLEENVRRLMSDARDALERLAPQARNFERARTMLFAPSYDRLGRTPVDLPDDQLEPLERPAAVLAALAAVARWSEPSAEAYLVEIRAVPLAKWRSVRTRVIHRALDIGIAVSRPLVERSAREHASPLPSWQELLAIQVRRFAEVSARTRANDLSAQEEAENWDLLLRECALAGVVVDDHIRQLAAQAVKRARAGAGAGVDLRAMETRELVALLERRELRRDAALILCERHEASSLPALFSAVRRMPRGEANLILPAVTSFGMSAEKWLIEGLKSKKAFMRQGCALALGQLKGPHGTDALVRLLVHEPTEIWSEVARALGDVGAQAVMPLAATLREGDAEARERVVQALAHVAAHGTRAPIEMLASGRDTLVAQAAQRALMLSGEVKVADERVRRGHASSEQTVVRGFSRRFYEALDGNPSGAIELDPGELEEIREEDAEEELYESLAVTSDEDTSGAHDLLTATDVPAFQPSPRRAEDTTNRTPRVDDSAAVPPKSSLPEGR